MLARFERMMEQAVEGSLRRAFSIQLQPVQMAKAAARAMEQAQVIGVRGREVPNHYELRLAPADLERFRGFQGTLSEEVSKYLRDYARERGFRPVADPRVELIGDARVRGGTVRVSARFADLSPPVQRQLDAAVEGTRKLRLADLAAAGPRPGASSEPRALVLTDDQGLRFELDRQPGIVRLGRAVDNDVVIASQRVSRYHAQLRWVDSSWLVYDLDSTNGTWHRGQRVSGDHPLAVDVGDSLRLGDHELMVRLDDRHVGLV